MAVYGRINNPQGKNQYTSGGGGNSKTPLISGAMPSQSFNSAFASNRAAGKDTFEWQGKVYNTKLATTVAPAGTPGGAFRGQRSDALTAAPQKVEIAAKRPYKDDKSASVNQRLASGAKEFARLSAERKVAEKAIIDNFRADGTKTDYRSVGNRISDATSRWLK